MKIGDIVNVKGYTEKYWKGKITDISIAFEHTFKDGSTWKTNYSKPIASVHAIKGEGYASVMESDLEIRTGGFYEK